jgi:hypothetical protein
MTPATAAALPTNPAAVGAELEQETKLAVGRLANVKIATVADLEQAVFDRQDLGARTKAVQAFFEPFKKQAHALWRGLCDRENAVLGPIVALDDKLKRAITDYKTEQDRLKREEEQRQANERRRQDEARAAEEAAHLERSGDHAMAAAVIETALAAPAPIVVLPDRTKVEGLKFRTEWKWRYVNNDRARAEQLIPREYMCSDEKKIGAYGRTMKETAKIPGIEFYSEQIPVR